MLALKEENNTVENRLRDIVAIILRMEDRQSEIYLESNLFELGLESLSVINLLTDIETEFDIVIDVEDLTADLFQNFGTLIKFVEEQVAQSK
jgi:acyl carrier protein